MRARSALALLLLAGCASAPRGADSTPPSDGRAVLARMHDRYAGRWFRTLTFVQRTTQRREGGSEQVSTWYESQRGDRLRIDVGDPAQGNGALYTADSLYVLRGGKVVRARAVGNPFLPLVVTVYLEPVDVAVRQLAPYGVDLDRVYTREWEGKPTYVVGASSAADTTSPQFWVERDRLIVTRFLLPLIPSADHHPQDVRLEENVPVGGGWLATRIRMLDRGKPLQTEEYSDWRADVDLPPTFFVAEHWSEGPHWARGLAK